LLEKNAGRSRVKLAFFCVVGVHVAGLMVLLMQGCKREPSIAPDVAGTPPPVVDANLTPVDVGITGAPPVVETGVTVPPPPIEPPPPPPPPPPPVVAQEYVIQSGDSYSTIAKKFPGVSVKAIQDANPTVNPLRLQIGQKLVIPPPVAKVEPPVNGTTDGISPTGGIVHTVKSGDALEKLAKQYGTTVKAIQEANGLTSTRINVGQKLKIPAKAPPPSGL